MNRPVLPAVVAAKVVTRLRDNSHIVGAVVAGLVTAMAIAALFVFQSHSYQQDLTATNAKASRLAVAYAKLRDQDFTLGVTPAAPSLAVVEDPTSKEVGLPVPKSFTASFPDGYFTCTDKTGDGNYACTVSHTHTAPTSTLPGR
jgi:hypothetical protein